MGKWKKYRKRPLVIKAKQMDTDFRVETLEGTMRGKPGDYLVEGIQGEHYIVKGDIFEETYEKVE